MTSKEALKQVNKYLTIYFNMTLHRAKETEVKWTEIEIIEKDLEMLEILKKSLKVKELTLNTFCIFFDCNSEENFEKVKEWLKNDK